MKHGTFSKVLKATTKFAMEAADVPTTQEISHVGIKMKTLLITFFDTNDIVHLEFIPQGKAVNRAYYMELLKRLREAVRRKRPERWPNGGILHHDNAPAHSSSSFVTKNRLPK
jgi:hypothetical protein